MIKTQLLSISEQLNTATPDDIVKVISLLAIATHHVEGSANPGRAEMLYVLLITQKVMEKYNDMMSTRPALMSRKTEDNFAKHITKVVNRLKVFSSELV